MKPDINTLLEGTKECKGYVTATDSLTINEENRLQKQVQQLQEQDDYNKYIIDKKINDLTSRLNQYEEMEKEGMIMTKEVFQQRKELDQKFADIYEKVNALMDQRKEERRRSRDYEMETDFIEKDNKFSILSFTSEKTLQQQEELERTLLEGKILRKEQNNK
jgi:hypothetical protein